MSKKQFIAQLAVSMENNESYMLGLGKSLLIHNEVDTIEEICRKIDSLKAEQLTDVANSKYSPTTRYCYTSNGRSRTVHTRTLHSRRGTLHELDRETNSV